ncbi:DUF1761 domain-containing protein [Rossellomorea vietnamensis]|uniref:DUF1761 domain-containing protein n=1 Tax=Rossellomorea vietnamensis TaxID=218284 RepID=A0A5D4KBH4_9BACI|nr:DUF1761 domain-containing protein [Rossellomorea vietnamensis]TYR74681.1 DUF1761 domain-containing protein [Rossellomorea vietnamensis]
MFEVSELSLTGILAGGILYMIYGAVYYSINVGKKAAGSGQSEGPMKYVVSVILAFISSLFTGLAVHAFGAGSLADGAVVGAGIGLLVSLLYLKNTLFGLISMRSFAVAAGDHLIIFTLLGLLHGFFH